MTWKSTAAAGVAAVAVIAFGAPVTPTGHAPAPHVAVLASAAHRAARSGTSLPRQRAASARTVNLSLYRFCSKPALYTGPNAPQPAAALTAGFSDAAKLDGALRTGFPSLAALSSIGPADGNAAANLAALHNHAIQCDRVNLQLDFRGRRQLPPVTATFLGFRFEPVTATAIISQAGRAPLTAIVYQDQGLCVTTSPCTGDSQDPFTTVAVARLQVRLTNVRVNGVPLNVGSSCRTRGILFTPGQRVAPGELVLTGGTNVGDASPSFGSAINGGAVAGEADIPPFTGCVTPSGDNLDPLLSATVSGPGNFTRMTIGQLCTNGGVISACAPSLEPLPAFEPIWTVTHGGRYSASGQLTLTSSAPDGITISCTSSAASGLFPSVSGPLRGGLATVRWARIRGCTGSDGSSWTIRQQGTAFFGTETTFGIPGFSLGNIDDITFTLTGTNAGTKRSCEVTVAGREGATFTSPPATLGANGAPTLHISRSTCPDAPADNATNANGDFALSATYPLRPAAITITEP
jgi:hypothetical protein